MNSVNALSATSALDLAGGQAVSPLESGVGTPGLRRGAAADALARKSRGAASVQPAATDFAQSLRQARMGRDDTLPRVTPDPSRVKHAFESSSDAQSSDPTATQPVLGEAADMEPYPDHWEPAPWMTPLADLLPAPTTPPNVAGLAAEAPRAAPALQGDDVRLSSRIASPPLTTEAAPQPGALPASTSAPAATDAASAAIAASTTTSLPPSGSRNSVQSTVPGAENPKPSMIIQAARPDGVGMGAAFDPPAAGRSAPSSAVALENVTESSMELTRSGALAPQDHPGADETGAMPVRGVPSAATTEPRPTMDRTADSSKPPPLFTVSRPTTADLSIQVTTAGLVESVAPRPASPAPRVAAARDASRSDAPSIPRDPDMGLVAGSILTASPATAASLPMSMSLPETQADPAGLWITPAALQPQAHTGPSPVPVTSSGDPGLEDIARERIATAMDDPAFPKVLGLQVSRMASDGVERAWLEVHPADMGPVAIQISVQGEQARLDFGAESAAARQIIEASLPDLASALQATGLTLSGGGIFEQLAQQQQQQRDASPESRSFGAGSNAMGSGGAGGIAGSGGSAIAESTRMPTTRADRQGLVDAYA